MRIKVYDLVASQIMKSILRISPILIVLMAVSFACNRYVSTKLGATATSNSQYITSIIPNPPAPPTPEEIYDSLYRATKAQKVDSVLQLAGDKWNFHGAVLVSQNGKKVYEGAVGTADFASGDSLSVDNVFQLASVSKQFTAMAVMMLQEQGKLDYDDLVTKYIPSLPYKTITVRQLLNHTSGLPNYMWLVEHKWKSETDPYNDDVIKLMAKHKLPLYFTPGRSFVYSNTGYVLLASIVEKVSGQRFNEFVAENIFQPLGMNQSYVYCTGLDLPEPEHVKGYLKKRWKFAEYGVDPNNGTVGDKNVFSTVEDLYKWDKALNTELLVCSETLNEAFTPGKVRRREIDYGFGFRLKNNRKENLVYHNGLWNGFRTSFIRDMDTGTTIILLNHTNCSAKSAVVNLIRKVLKEDEDIELDLEVSPDDVLASTN